MAGPSEGGVGAGGFGKAIGELIHGQPKLKTVWGNDALARIQTDPDKYPSLLADLIASGKKAKIDFGAALDLGLPEATRIQAEDIANLGRLTKEGMAYNPLDYYDHVLNSKTNGPSGVRSFLPDLANSVNGVVSRRGLAAGLNGTGNNAYNTRVASAEMGNQFAPILRDIYNTSAADSAVLGNQRLSNIGNTVNLMRERVGIPDRLANRSLLPFQAEAGMLGDQFALSNQLAEATNTNIQGHQLKANAWANLDQAIGEGIDTTLDNSMNMLASLYSSYSGSSGYGGGGGGGGGAPPPSQAPAGYSWGNTFGYAQPQRDFGYNPNNLGGYNYNAAPYRGPYDGYKMDTNMTW